MKSMNARIFGVLATLSAFTSAFGQAAINYDPSQGNPYIKVPRTSTYIPGKPRTMHLIYTGTPAAPGFSPLAMHGPYAELAANIPGYHPADIQTAYGLQGVEGAGAIAIVDMNNLTSSLTDFNTFSQQFGLPQETSSDPLSPNNKVFQVVYAEGVKPTDDNTGWGGEIALDIEWAHAMAPKAKIYLVESTGDLAAANLVASALPGVREVSNSWIIYGELSTEQQMDADFIRPGVTFFAGSGDIGGLQGWPSTSPNIISCGGT